MARLNYNVTRCLNFKSFTYHVAYDVIFLTAELQRDSHVPRGRGVFHVNRPQTHAWDILDALDAWKAFWRPRCRLPRVRHGLQQWDRLPVCFIWQYNVTISDIVKRYNSFRSIKNYYLLDNLLTFLKFCVYLAKKSMPYKHRAMSGFLLIRRSDAAIVWARTLNSQISSPVACVSHIRQPCEF